MYYMITVNYCGHMSCFDILSIMQGRRSEMLTCRLS